MEVLSEAGVEAREWRKEQKQVQALNGSDWFLRRTTPMKMPSKKTTTATNLYSLIRNMIQLIMRLLNRIATNREQ